MVCNIVLSAKVLCFLEEILAELFWRKWRCGESNLFSVTCGHGTTWNIRVELCCNIILNPHGTWCDWTLCTHFTGSEVFVQKSWKLKRGKIVIWSMYQGPPVDNIRLRNSCSLFAWKVQSLECVWLILFNNRPFS